MLVQSSIRGEEESSLAVPQRKRSAETKAAPQAPAKAQYRTAPGSALRFSRSASQALPLYFESLAAQVGGF